ncbi:MAG: zinc ribbon domain-containing protein [bacterium]|nr:zinc ribbon domain-containing protein [bacterium]
MICPKCKSQNDDDATVCSNCGFKLKLKCPYCGTYNTVGAKSCSACGKQLLKLCPSCKAVNFSTAKVCRKCSAPFSAAPKVEQTDDTISLNLEKYATLAVELINISSIKTNIKPQEVAAKVINKFYQIFAKASKDAGLKALKLTENTLAVSFSTAPSFADSVNTAVEFAGALDNVIDEISDLLESKLKISYKTRYLITGLRPVNKLEISSSIALGVVDDVIFDEEVYAVLKDKLTFKEIQSQDGKKFYKFLNQDDPEVMVAETVKEPPAKTRMDIVNDMINKVQMAKEGFVAVLNGVTGVGKSNIFSALRMTFEEDNSHVWLLGQCSLQSPHSPIFFFKSVLQNLFDIPSFNIDLETTKKRVYTYMADKLGLTEESLIADVFAILFYDETRLERSIYENKRSSYNAISSIFRALLSRGAVVLQIEDIECIDRFSLDILRGLFDEGILKCDFKIFVTGNLETDIVQFFASPHVNYENSFFAQYPVMTKAEIDDFIKKAIGVREELGANVLNHVYDNAFGMPVFVEEFLYMFLQLGLVKFTGDNANPVSISQNINTLTFPKTTKELIQVRLTNISNANPNAFKTLYYASILGFKFLPAVVQNILQIDSDSFNEIIKFLSMNNFIAPFDTFNYTFKSRIIWETVRNLQLSPENKVTSVTSAMKTLVQLTQPDMATVIHNLLDVSVPKHEIIGYIETATKEAYTVGDDYSYICSKSLLLDAVEVSTIENKADIMLSIKEELLNMTYMTFPDTAIKFADELIAHYEPIDSAKTIDILGIMSIAFENTGNYLAAVECADKALEKIDAKTNKLSSMLLKYSKLNSILNLGRYEELINLARNEILPVIGLQLSAKLNEETTLSQEEFISIMFETKYKCAMALALQGSLSANDAALALYKEASDNQNQEYMIKAQLVKGVLALLQGNIQDVENVLASTKDAIPGTKDSTNDTFFWLALKNIAGYLKGEYAQVANDLMMLANFSQNIGKFSYEPIIKGLIVKIALSDGNVDFAQNLAYDEAYKCANNQWALGALMNWYMYGNISIFKEKYEDALKVAQKALDVAEKATINNLFFTSLLKMKLGEIYGIRGDCDMAKINLQEAMQIAEINGYYSIKAYIANPYYDVLLKQVAANPSLKDENIKAIHKQLVASGEAAKYIQNADLNMQIKQKLETIEDYAQQNNIALS